MATSKIGRGFTLVEILVALTIIAVALTATMRNFGQSVDTTIALRDRMIALWVAQNRLALHYASNRWPNTSTSDGVTEMAGRRWYWREEVTTTPDPELRRVEINVASARGEEGIVTLFGYLSKPADP